MSTWDLRTHKYVLIRNRTILLEPEGIERLEEKKGHCKRRDESGDMLMGQERVK